ncbi:MAG: tetratricopeptide repeat protein [Planctomycetota bacterium]
MRLESGRSVDGRLPNASAVTVTAYELYNQGKLCEVVSHLRAHSDLEDEELLFLLAKALTKLQEYTEAKKNIQKVLQKPILKSTPKEYEARLFLANLYLETGEISQAIREFTKIKENPEACEIYRSTFSGLACANALLGRFNKAFMCLDKARSFPGSEESVDADFGFILLVEGSYEEALNIFVDVFRKQPDNVRNTYHLANTRYLCGQYQQAIDILKQGISREPQAIFLRIMMGDIYKALGKYTESIQHYQLCLTISPRSEKKDYILFQLANCERFYDYQNQSIQDYQQLLKNCPRSHYKQAAASYIRNLNRHVQQGIQEPMKIFQFPRFLSRRERFFPLAIAQLLKFWNITKERIQIPLERIEAGISLAYLRTYARKFGLEQKCFVSTLEQLKRILALGFPILVHEYAGLQGHYINLIGYDDAKEVLIAQDPSFHESQEILYQTFLKNWKFHSYKAFLLYPQTKEALLQTEIFEEKPAFDLFDEISLLLEDGEQEKAILKLQELREKYPEDRSGLRLEIEINLQQKNNVYSEKLAKMAVQTFPDEYWTHRLLGDSYFNLQQYDSALISYINAKTSLPKNAELLAKIGETLIFLGKPEAGIQSLRKSIRLDPRDFWAYGKLGWGYLKKSQFRRAEEQMLYALDSTLDYNDTWGWLHAQLGVLYRHCQQYDKSVLHLKKSLTSHDKEPWFEEEYQKSYKLLRDLS